jgi:hypothetical protein
MSKKEKICPQCLAKINSQILQVDVRLSQLISDVRQIKLLLAKLGEK